jgi:chromosome transmission fidelity protein 1
LSLLSDNLIEQTHDIEELSTRCHRLKVCGYFASRQVALEKADVIVTPYQSILSEATRNALGINLDQRIVVFDEAHNLMDSITSINSIEIGKAHLKAAKESIEEYSAKYKARMNPKNVKMLGDLAMVLGSFQTFFEKRKGEMTLDVIEVLTETDLYNFDFSKLLSFFDKADVVKKLNGYV